VIHYSRRLDSTVLTHPITATHNSGHGTLGPAVALIQFPNRIVLPEPVISTTVLNIAVVRYVVFTTSAVRQTSLVAGSFCAHR
jgi:hypothetical protein